MAKEDSIKSFCMLYQMSPIDIPSLTLMRASQITELIIKSGDLFKKYQYTWFFNVEIINLPKNECIDNISKTLKGSMDLEIDLIKMSKKDVQKIWTMINNVTNCIKVTEEDKEEDIIDWEEKIKQMNKEKDNKINSQFFCIGICFFILLCWLLPKIFYWAEHY